MNGALTLGDLVKAAESLETIAALLPARYRGFADDAFERAKVLRRACAAVQAAVVAEQAANPRQPGNT